LCSPPPTPTATPPPQSMYQQKQQPKPAQTSTFGNKFPPQKINYQNEIFNRGIDKKALNSQLKISRN